MKPKTAQDVEIGQMWLCAECKRPVELRYSYGELGVYCPVNDGLHSKWGWNHCTPRQDRWLINDDQVERLDGTPCATEPADFKP